MNTYRGYRLLCAAVGVLLTLLGLLLFAGFFLYQRPGMPPPLPTGPVGHYMMAMAGCALVAWGGGLIGAARQPRSGRTMGTVTALALVMMAVYRMLGWLVGDYYEFAGEVLRVEAALFLLLALAFLWLRPPHLKGAS